MNPASVPAQPSQSGAVFDVCVVGGGPAGAVAAALLARWGYSAAIIHREPRQHAVAESLPASTRKVFRFVDLLDTIEAENFPANDGNISSWAGSPAKTTSDAPGYHVDRGRFDAALRRHARHAGVTDIPGAVRRVTIGEPTTIDCDAAGERRTYRARFVLDCSGRAGVVGRRLTERRMAGYRTLALIANWQSTEWESEEATRTVIESSAAGWAWAVPLDGNRRQVTAMVDPEFGSRARSDLATQYHLALANTRGFLPRLSRAQQLSRPWSCDATVYESVRTADAGVLLVGDAASFVEPLSSAGVKKAMLSAWRAAVVVNTSLKSSDMADAAAAYFDAREHEVFSACVQRAGGFFSAALDEHPTEFWRSRTVACADLQRRDGNAPDTRVRDAALRQAYSRLRDAPAAVRFTPGARLQFAAAPEILARELVMREGLVLPGDTTPTVFAGGVDLAALTRIAIQCDGIDALIAQYERRIGEVGPAELLAAVCRLVAAGVIVQVDHLAS